MHGMPSFVIAMYSHITRTPLSLKPAITKLFGLDDNINKLESGAIQNHSKISKPLNTLAARCKRRVNALINKKDNAFTN